MVLHSLSWRTACIGFGLECLKLYESERWVYTRCHRQPLRHPGWQISLIRFGLDFRDLKI